MNERNLIQEMKKKKKYGVHLNEYTQYFSTMYYEYASIQLAFSYYTVYEILSEMEDCTFIAPVFQELTSDLSLQGETAITAINTLRDRIIEIMDCVTLYTDALCIFEHILSRVEYRFRDDAVVPDLSVVTTRIQQFIFADKDAVVTNDKIKSIVSELPLRMTKQRFYDIVSDSLSIYKDSDEEGVLGFVYMLRTIAGLKRDYQPVDGLRDMTAFIKECETTDYANISRADYERMRTQLNEYTEELNQIVTIYIQIQECINHFYTMQLCAPHMGSAGSACASAMAMVEQIRRNVDDADTESVLNGCNEHLEALEGKQESVMERLMEYEALLGDVASEHGDDVAVQSLVTCSKLVSSSMFIDLNAGENSVPVTDDFLQKTTASLLQEFADFFKSHSQIVNRAVMSRVLGAVPVFFNSADEVSEYVAYALEHCSDKSELAASIAIINQIIE
jgi:hypothetical protein